MIAEIAACWIPWWFVTARWLYGRWRGFTWHRFDYLARRVTRRCPDGMAAAMAMLAALAWPLVLLTVLVRWRPPRSPAEVASEAQQLAESVKALRQANDDWEREMRRAAQ
jgi:hypothetical protein